MSDEKLILLKRHSVTPNLSFYGTKPRVEFSGSCLKQDKVTFNHGKIVNMYIVYEISKNIDISDYPTLQNWLFGAISLTKNADIDKYKYSGYGIGFDRHGHGSVSFLGFGLGRNVIVFGVDTSSSIHIENKEKYVWFWLKVRYKEYNIHWLEKKHIWKKFCFIMHYNWVNSYFFVNGKEIHKFKAKDSEIVETPLC